jgi:hypothetical protein
MANNDYLFQLGYATTADLPEPSDPFSSRGLDGLPCAAQHIIIDANDCSATLDYEFFTRTLLEMNLTITSNNPRKNRILVIQAYSGDDQISITVWSERRYVSFDYFALSPINVSELITTIKTALMSSDIRVTRLLRGDKYDRHNSTTNSC